ncbi:helix-turn-helix transcriptional regulator, partial [Alistipes onderdonkii]|nr:helix-turn-helix transcriptional regulator [Alistipes onderdonkii]
ASLLREGCTSGESLERMAERLGYTDRPLRRAFQREFEVTPVQYLQTCRLLLAKSLLTDSDLPVSQVAAAAGFKSVRRFNDLF